LFLIRRLLRISRARIQQVLWGHNDETILYLRAALDKCLAAEFNSSVCGSREIFYVLFMFLVEVDILIGTKSQPQGERTNSVSLKKYYIEITVVCYGFEDRQAWFDRDKSS
jgi:hypothetical protein